VNDDGDLLDWSYLVGVRLTGLPLYVVQSICIAVDQYSCAGEEQETGHHAYGSSAYACKPHVGGPHGAHPAPTSSQVQSSIGVLPASVSFHSLHGQPAEARPIRWLNVVLQTGRTSTSVIMLVE